MVKGIAKLDLQAPSGTQEAAVGQVEYPEGMRGGEAFFVPRHEDPAQCAGGPGGSSRAWDVTFVRRQDNFGMGCTPGQVAPSCHPFCSVAAASPVCPPASADAALFAPLLVPTTFVCCHSTHAGEDDGYLMVYVYSPKQDTSFLHIYDAATMSPDPVAAVQLPQRVPFGFHTTWITGQQIKQQKLELPQ